jgi:hypothetical protein
MHLHQHQHQHLQQYLEPLSSFHPSIEHRPCPYTCDSGLLREHLKHLLEAIDVLVYKS